MYKPLSTCLFLVILFPALAPAAVPVLYCTDLNHPHGDPDDHFDLATLFALDEFDIRGIVLDNVISQDERPGAIPVRQMLHLTGKDIPFAVGLTQRLKSLDDEGRAEDPRFQAGVELILKTLREADEPVTIITAGTVRDVAAAFNRDPELLRKKTARLYINIGYALRDHNKPEYNAGLDPYAYARILSSGLPVYWCPCFSGKLWKAKEGYATFWRFHHHEVLPHIPEPLQNFFIFALAKPEGVDPIAFLTAEQDPKRRDAVWKLRRNMWCTAPFFHAAGREVFRLKDGTYAALSPEAAQGLGVAKNRVDAYTFEPAKVEIRAKAMSPTDRLVPMTVEFDAAEPDLHLFRQTAANYEAIMTSCLRRLFAEFPWKKTR